MRNLILLLIGVALVSFLLSCQKEISQEFGTAAKGSLQNTAGDCLPKQVGGSFVANRALNDSHYLEVSVDVSSTGPYTITTDTINGYSFKGTGTFTSTGASTIRLKASGTPSVAGINNFTVVFDTTFCQVAVTVAPPGSGGGGQNPTNTDYFPIAANNWWSYSYTGGAADTLTLKVTGAATIGGTAYQRFEWSSPGAGGAFAEYFYRKDASTGFYYEGIDTAGFGPQVIFTNTGALHINFLRNTLTTGQTWTTDYPVTLNITGFSGPSVLRFKYTCDNNNTTVTSATGSTINNVYQITSVLQANIGGQFVDVGDPIKTYYAKGIGQVKYREDTNPASIYEETIRYWQVN